MTQLDGVIKDTIEGLGNDSVAVADTSQAYQPNGVSHIWCRDAPWAYGLSIHHVSDPYSFASQAPFHPTRRGRQQSIAEQTIPAVRHLFPGATASPRPTTTLMAPVP